MLTLDGYHEQTKSETVLWMFSHIIQCTLWPEYYRNMEPLEVMTKKVRLFLN